MKKIKSRIVPILLISILFINVFNTVIYETNNKKENKKENVTTGNLTEETSTEEKEENKESNTVNNSSENKTDEKENQIDSNQITDSNNINNINTDESNKTTNSSNNNSTTNEILEDNDVEENQEIKDNDKNNTNKTNQKVEKSNTNNLISYKAHIQGDGWQETRYDGKTSGTTGKSLRLEAITIELGENLKNLNIEYQAHIQNLGWQEWKQNGEVAGTEGQSLRLEAIKIKLKESNDYSIKYRVHIQNLGWQEWKQDGEIAGTEGQKLRVEAIEIKIVPKEKVGLIHVDSPEFNSTVYSPEKITISGWKMSNVYNTKIEAYIDNKKIENIDVSYSARQDVIDEIRGYGTIDENPKPGFEFTIDASKFKDGKKDIHLFIADEKGNHIREYILTINIDRKLHIEYNAHLQSLDWQKDSYDGEVTGTEGRSLRLEALKINLIGAPSNAKVLYKAHIQGTGWQNWKESGEVAGTEGKSLRLEAIQIKLENLDEYTVEYQVHMQNIGWSNWYIDGETAGTIGQSRRIEAIRIRLVPKYKREYRGIDVSQFNGNIDWNGVKSSGIDFAYIRIGYRGYGQAGNFREDSQFRRNIEEAQRVGIPVGIYFVTQAITPEEAIEEANWVYERIRAYNIEYPVALDIEAAKVAPGDIPRTINLDNETRTYLAELFCQTIQNYGYTPIIYTNLNWANNKLNMSELSEFDTWIARYRDISLGPGYDREYAIWQYSSEGRINGISGKVDLNICYKKF